LEPTAQTSLEPEPQTELRLEVVGLVTAAQFAEAVVLFTVTVRFAEQPVFDEVSIAHTLRVCEPFPREVVFTLVVKMFAGLSVKVFPVWEPSTTRMTSATPWSSTTLAVKERFPETVALFAGAVMNTVGGVVSGVVFVTQVEPSGCVPVGQMQAVPLLFGTNGAAQTSGSVPPLSPPPPPHPKMLRRPKTKNIIMTKCFLFMSYGIAMALVIFILLVGVCCWFCFQS
jgi:hypothetical protein